MNRLVVVSNRVPLPSAGPQAGGLAVALEGLMTRRGGMWCGWSGEVADRPGIVHVERAGNVEYATFDLTAAEHEGYYNRFANGVLWPLLHTMPQLMSYDREDGRTYRAVNERIAGLLQPMLRITDLIWIHDYHLLPLAAALRAREVRNPIGFFLHIPFATADVIAAAPEMASLVRDMLGADLLGFQTDNDMRNFATAAQSLAGAARMPGNILQIGPRRVRLAVFPVEIDVHAFAAIASELADSEATDRLRTSIGGEALILGIDRLDPTKGLPQRFDGVRTLFEKYPAWKRRATVLQIAATSRKDVQSYQQLRTTLDREAGALNADLGEPDWQPLRFITTGVPRDVVAGYMRLARVGLVTPVRDGMNLVAKEYVAARDPADPGVLVLSKFAGAAHQLDAALLVNPHDTDALADAMHSALSMGLAERRDRWRALWASLEDRTPYIWGSDFVDMLMRATAFPDGLEQPQRVLGGDGPAIPGLGVADSRLGDRIALLGRLGAERDPSVRVPLPRSAGARRQLN
jgi:trehalose 6-phosphate synthase